MSHANRNSIGRVRAGKALLIRTRQLLGILR